MFSHVGLQSFPHGRGTLVAVAVLLAWFIATVLTTVALAQEDAEDADTHDLETSRIMTLDGPDCEAHQPDFALEGAPPQVTISGLEKCLAPDSSDAFTVTASNLDAAEDYTVTLQVTGQVSGRFGFDAECATASLAYNSADSAAAITQSPTLYSCGTATAINVLHATLTQTQTDGEGEDQTEIEVETSRTSDYLLFIIPPTGGR